MSFVRWIAASAFVASFSLPASAVLLEGVKITKVSLGYYGSNTFYIHVDPNGPGSGTCKTAGFAGFQARNWPYSNTAGVDTAQFDRIFSMMVTAFTTGQLVTVEGTDTDCHSSVFATMYP